MVESSPSRSSSSERRALEKERAKAGNLLEQCAEARVRESHASRAGARAVGDHAGRAAVARFEERDLAKEVT
jgi:hypothetical protein